RPVRAPVRVRIALVACVVPCTKRSVAPSSAVRPRPSCSAARRTASSTPLSSEPGVVGALDTVRPPPSLAATQSVKVPPMSTAIRYLTLFGLPRKGYPKARQAAEGQQGEEPEDDDKRYGGPEPEVGSLLPDKRSRGVVRPDQGEEDDVPDHVHGKRGEDRVRQVRDGAEDHPDQEEEKQLGPEEALRRPVPEGEEHGGDRHREH